MKRREIIAGLGSAAAWPLMARAQQPVLPEIGFLNPGSPDTNTDDNLRTFRQSLKDAGYVEGDNVSIVYRWRWRVERDYEDLKQEIGLGHYEGRGWRGFHHHGTLAIAAYGFLISEREGIPPSGPHSAAPIEKSPFPSGYRPRGAPDPATAPHPQLDCHDPSRADRRDCKQTSAMSALRAPHSQ